MRILGIETSCDETGAAVVENGTKILSNVVASSIQFHKKTGGIIPEVAAREQVKCIIPVVEEALKTGCRWVVGSGSGCEDEGEEKKKKLTPTTHPRLTTHNSPSPPIDALAVTVGPGLIGSLLVGVETAKTLAYAWEKPIVPVNHLVAHIYANWLVKEQESERARDQEEPKFPALALVVSGGHTDLVLMKDHPSRGRGKLRWLGGTRDDAAGECFDKSARLLDLGYPGGPAISTAAEKFKNPACRQGRENLKFKIELPRPMIKEENFDFSFSGLKTAVLREVQNLKNNQPFDAAQGKQFNNITIQQLSFELQEAITDVLVTKTIKAAEKYKAKSILLAGGVSANSRLCEKFSLLLSRSPALSLFVPPARLCTDNAAFIASCAFFNYQPVPWQNISVNPGLTISDKI